MIAPVRSSHSRRPPKFSHLNAVKRFPLIGRSVRRRLLLAGAGLALLLTLLVVPAVSVGAQSVYPPNTVISTYYDARYGLVSVVTDATGNLIDINAVTGQRIYPIYPDYGYVSVNGNVIVPATGGVSYAYPQFVTYPYPYAGLIG